MHPFGGTPICPRCSKAVYAAEQTMGPGRKLYHKQCLTCNSCNKSLSSGSLVDHDQMPYCTTCHKRMFGAQGLRQAGIPPKGQSPCSTPVRYSNGNLATQRPSSMPSACHENQRVDLTSKPLIAGSSVESASTKETKATEEETANKNEECEAISHRQSTSKTSDQPLSPSFIFKHKSNLSGLDSPSTAKKQRWGGATATCARCENNVYFVELVKAVGKTWHKGCLCCTACKTGLDTGQLCDRGGDPMCQPCYNKLHGPQALRTSSLTK